MTLAQMCLQASVMIVVILLLRSLLVKRLPKTALLVLWGLVLVRLLVPVSVPFPANLWTLIDRGADRAGIEVPASLPVERASSSTQTAPDPAADDVPPADANMASDALPQDFETVLPETRPAPSVDLANLVWIVGAVACGAFFTVLYARHLHRFRLATRVRSLAARQWLAGHPLRRKIEVKESGAVQSPMTYGILRPVILVPPGFDWHDRVRATLVLEHEFVHIWRFDPVYKALLVMAVCLYWFNPLVWVMYFLANRDIELACDERVIRRLNPSGRTNYAHTLLDMAERGAVPMPITSGFGKNAIEERILAIVDAKDPTLPGMLATLVLASGIAVTCATTGMPLPGPVSVAGIASVETPPMVEAPDTDPVRLACQIPTENGWRVTTPLYSLNISTELMPQGFTWEYHEQGGEYTPAGATSCFVGFDAATGEVAFSAYLLPRASSQSEEPGVAALEGFRHVMAISLMDGNDIVLAVSETAVADVDAWFVRENTYGKLACFSSEGSHGDIHGLNGATASPDAYIAHAAQLESSVRIDVPGFSVTVPNDALSQVRPHYRPNGGILEFFYNDNPTTSVEVRCVPAGTQPNSGPFCVETVFPLTDDLHVLVSLLWPGGPAPDDPDALLEQWASWVAPEGAAAAFPPSKETVEGSYLPSGTVGL